MRYLATLLAFVLLAVSPAESQVECRQYSFDPEAARKAYLGTVVEEVRNEEFERLPDGRLAINSIKMKDISSTVSQGVYRALNGRLRITVPRLSTGRVSVHQGSRQLAAGEPPTFTVKFSEEGHGWRAAVVVIDVPDELPKGEFMLKAFEDQQRGLLQNVPPENYTLCRANGPLGEGVEVIVHGQIPAGISVNGVFTGITPKNVQHSTTVLLNDWPHATTVVDAKAPTIGIRRELRVGNAVIEFCLIVIPPKDSSPANAIKFARKEMDAFVSAVQISK